MKIGDGIIVIKVILFDDYLINPRTNIQTKTNIQKVIFCCSSKKSRKGIFHPIRNQVNLHT